MNLNDLMKAKLEAGEGRRPGEKKDETTIAEDDEVRLSALQQNVMKVLDQLQHEQNQMRQAHKQREDVLKLLNRGYTKDPLSIVVKEVLKHEQKHRCLVMRDILRLSDTLRQASANPSNHNSDSCSSIEDPSAVTSIDPSTLDTKHFKNQLAMLRVEAEHIQKRFQWKESEIVSLRQEVLSLKQRLGDFKFISPQQQVGNSSTSLHSSASLPSQTPPQSALCASCSKPLLSKAPSKENVAAKAYTGSKNKDYTAAKPGSKKLPTASSLPRHAKKGTPSSSHQKKTEQNTRHLTTYYGTNRRQDDAGSRRNSVNRADLDQMQVNADQYLQEDEEEEEEENEEEHEREEDGEEDEEEEEGEEEEEEGEDEEEEGEEGEEENGEGNDEEEEDEEQEEESDAEEEKTPAKAIKSKKLKNGGGSNNTKLDNSAFYQAHARRKPSQR